MGLFNFRSNNDKKAYEKALAELRKKELERKRKEAQKSQENKKLDTSDVLSGASIAEKSKHNLDEKNKNSAIGGGVVERPFASSGELPSSLPLDMDKQKTFGLAGKKRASSEVVDIRSYKHSEVSPKSSTSFAPSPTQLSSVPSGFENNKTKISPTPVTFPLFNEKKDKDELKKEEPKLSYFEQFMKELEEGENKKEKPDVTELGGAESTENGIEKIEPIRPQIVKTTTRSTISVPTRPQNGPALNNLIVSKPILPEIKTQTKPQPTKAVSKNKRKKRIDIDILNDGYDGDII